MQNIIFNDIKTNVTKRADRSTIFLAQIPRRSWCGACVCNYAWNMRARWESFATLCTWHSIDVFGYVSADWTVDTTTFCAHLGGKYQPNEPKFIYLWSCNMAWARAWVLHFKWNGPYIRTGKLQTFAYVFLRIVFLFMCCKLAYSIYTWIKLTTG